VRQPGTQQRHLPPRASRVRPRKNRTYKQPSIMSCLYLQFLDGLGAAARPAAADAHGSFVSSFLRFFDVKTVGTFQRHCEDGRLIPYTLCSVQ
jgi:hypothetical protein